jgi:hypothetical protein
MSGLTAVGRAAKKASAQMTPVEPAHQQKWKE